MDLMDGNEEIDIITKIAIDLLRICMMSKRSGGFGLRKDQHF